MKTRLASLIVAFVATFALSSFAQQSPAAPNGLPAEMKPAERLKEMQAHLDLSSDQVAKIKAVFEADRPTVEALRANQSLTPQQKKEQLQVIRKNSREQIAKILSPMQKIKWMQFQKSKANASQGTN